MSRALFSRVVGSLVGGSSRRLPPLSQSAVAALETIGVYAGPNVRNYSGTTLMVDQKTLLNCPAPKI